MSVPDPQRSSAWDKLFIDGTLIPGIAKVSARLGDPLDVQQPKGAKRAYVKDKGFPPIVLQCQIQLTGHTQIAEFQRVGVPLLKPRAADAPSQPREVTHPEAELWGVNIVKVGGVDSAHPESGARKFITFSLVEWVPAPKKLKKPAKGPKGEGTESEDAAWNVQPLVDDLRPGNTDAAAENFSAGFFP